MGFFKKLFGKKPGGSLFGNLLRGVTSSVSGGILGSGKGIIGVEWDLNKDGKFSDDELAFHKSGGTDSTLLQKITGSIGGAIGGLTAAGGSTATPPLSGNTTIDDRLKQIGDTLGGFIDQVTPKVETSNKTNTILIIAACIIGIPLIISLFKRR